MGSASLMRRLTTRRPSGERPRMLHRSLGRYSSARSSMFGSSERMASSLSSASLAAWTKKSARPHEAMLAR